LTSTAPGPGLAVLLRIAEMRRDPFAFMERLHAQYGDVVRIVIGTDVAHLLAHPDHADHVLRVRHANYDRETRSASAVRLVTGDSILTTSGEEWRRHRLLLQPAFHRTVVESFAPLIAQETSAMLDRWDRTRGKVIDVAAEMMHLTFSIAGKAFFGADVGSEADEIETLMPDILKKAFERSATPTWMHRLIRGADDDVLADAHRQLVAIVERIPASQSTLLSRLEGLSDEESRNDAIALLLAGHETTANALAWTFYLLGRHPEIAIANDEQLTHAVIDEVLRLYPPIWIIERHALEEDEIGGYEIPADSIIYVSPFVLHRHRDFWSDPKSFDPSRFLGGVKHHAYLPFGAGAHHCLGAHFAVVEARTIVAAIARRGTLKLATNDVIKPEPWLTLRPRGGVPMVWS
jgi:cytochrome P450